MALVVQKYGGSSVQDAERIRRVAERIVRTGKDGHDVVVVASAMGDTTDELTDLAMQVHPSPPPRELDMLLTSGERISNALLAMAINAQGGRARSFTGSQAGMITDGIHGKARLLQAQRRKILLMHSLSLLGQQIEQNGIVFLPVARVVQLGAELLAAKNHI